MNRSTEGDGMRRLMRSVQGTVLRPTRGGAHGKKGSGLSSKTEQQATPETIDTGLNFTSKPELIGPACTWQQPGDQYRGRLPLRFYTPTSEIP